MVAFIPALIMGGMALGSFIKGSMKGKKEKSLQKQQEGAATSLQTKADTAIPYWNQQGATYDAKGRAVRNKPGNAQAMNYYSAMLGGDRSKLMSAAAPQRGQINDLYGGQARSLDASGMRGTQKARAMADLERNRVQSLASTVQGQAPMAANALANMEQGMDASEQGWAGLGANAKQYGWANYSNLMKGAFDARDSLLQQQQADRQKWSALGASLAPLAGYAIEGAFNKGGKSPTPTVGRDLPGATQTIGGTMDRYGTPQNWQLPRGNLYGPMPGNSSVMGGWGKANAGGLLGGKLSPTGWAPTPQPSKFGNLSFY